MWKFKFLFSIYRKLLKKKKKKKQLLLIEYIYFFIVYESNKWSRDLNSDFTVKDCLFGGDILAKNAGLDKYVYSG